jgi:2,3-diphosphopglycerate-independent phosphoglycerate mutase
MLWQVRRHWRSMRLPRPPHAPTLTSPPATHAATGLNGLMDPVSPGLACGSDTAHLSILGYDPRVYYRGRGAFESMGAGMDMLPGDIAFKSNFAHVSEADGSTVLLRRVDRDFPAWGVPLCAHLDGMPVPGFPDVGVAVRFATEHRCGVRLRGPGLSDAISGNDPLKDGLPLVRSEALPAEPGAPADPAPAAVRTAAVVNALTAELHARLRAHPLNVARAAAGLPTANMVLLRGPGARLAVPTFQEVHAMRAFMIAPTCIIAGLGMSLGIDVVRVPGATGDYHSDLLAKARAAVAHLTPALPGGRAAFDFCFLHVKAVDDAGHDRSVARKLEWLERSDVMVAHLVHALGAGGDECVMVVTGDHSTPVLSGDHSTEPVPFLISRCGPASALLRARGQPAAASPSAGSSGEGLPQPHPLADRVLCFSEHEAAAGALGRFPGSEVMALIRNFVAEAEAGAVSSDVSDV